MRTAKEVYIFSVEAPINSPRGKQLRLLDPKARDTLEDILGDERNWLHGWDHRTCTGGNQKNVGFVFRQENEELTLMQYPGFIKATFNSATAGSGSLDDKASGELGEWKRQYAKPELAEKRS